MASLLSSSHRDWRPPRVRLPTPLRGAEAPDAAARDPCAERGDLRRHALPNALSRSEDLRREPRRLVVFLDYDGTLTPIVEESAAARMSQPMREALRRLSSRATVAVVSGRAREKIREFVDLSDLYYAGSHGFDIDGPGGLRHAVSQDAVPLLAEARKALEGKLGAVEGCALEDNRFSVSVHWRKCAPRRDAIERVVDDVLASPPFAGALRKSEGKCVFELRPDVAWDKGSAVLYLLDMLRARDQAGGADAPESWYRGVLPVYVGDDTTDEDAFRALSRYDAVSVLVAPKAEAERPRLTHATHTLRDVDDVLAFLDALASIPPVAS